MTIPTDLASWDPTDATLWLSDLACDESVSNADWTQAQLAVHAALLGD